MRKLAKMSGDVRDGAGFTFQAGREIQEGTGCFQLMFYTVQVQSVHQPFDETHLDKITQLQSRR